MVFHVAKIDGIYWGFPKSCNKSKLTDAYFFQMGFLQKKRNLVLQIIDNQYILLATLGSWNLGRNHVPVHLTSLPDPWDIGRKNILYTSHQF